MNDAVKSKLKKLIQRCGKGLCKDARRTEAFLRDACGEHTLEINLLLTPVRLGITQEMLQFPDKTVDLRVAGWVTRLYGEAGLDRARAVWTIDTWLDALGINHASLKESVAQSTMATPAEGATISAEEETDEAGIHYRQGIARGKSGDHRGAIEALEKAISINPNHADSHYALGVAYVKIECYVQAKEMFRQAKELNPDYGDPKRYPMVKNLLLEERN